MRITKHILKFILPVFILISCTSEDDTEAQNDDNDGNPPVENQARLLNKIGNFTFNSEQDLSAILYQNDKPFHIYRYCCEVTNSNGSFNQGNIFQFSFNADDKISEVYVKSFQFPLNNILPNEFGTENVALAENQIFTYSYNGSGQLIEIMPENFQTKRLTFSYSNNQISQIDEFIKQNDGTFNLAIERNFIFSSDNNVESISKTFTSSGNTFTTTFQYDQQINPFFTLNDRFGLVDFAFNLTGFEFGSDNFEYFFSENNVVGITSDGNQTNFSYDYEQGNPIKLNGTSDGFDIFQDIEYE